MMSTRVTTTTVTTTAAHDDDDDDGDDDDEYDDGHARDCPSSLGGFPFFLFFKFELSFL